MPFEAQQYDIREILIGPFKETTYGTALLDASLTHRLRAAPGDFATILRTYRSDVDHSGKGHPFATERQVVQVDSQYQMTQEVTDFVAGWLLAWAMAHETVTGTGPYTHAFIFENATNIAPVTTVFFRDTADVLFKLADLFMTDLEISGTPTGPVIAKASFAGSGKQVLGDLGGGGSAAVALPTNVYLLGSDVDVQIGAVGAPVSIKERVKSWSVKIQTGIEIHRGSGGGLFATMHKLGLPKISFQIAVAAKNVDDIRTLFLNDTLQELDILCNSGASAQMNFIFKGVYLAAAKMGLDKIEEVWTISGDDKGIIKNGANEVLTVNVLNSVAASYLVAG